MKNDFKTTHNLDFNVAPYKSREPMPAPVKVFNIGTCTGIWGVTRDGYQIYSVNNSKIGNGHFTDVIEWFEFSAKRDGGSVVFANVDNEKLKQHLIDKKGYKKDGETNVIKHFDVLLAAN